MNGTHFEFSFTVDPDQIAWSRHVNAQIDADSIAIFKDEGGITVVVPSEGDHLGSLLSAAVRARDYLIEDLALEDVPAEPWRYVGVSRELLERHFLTTYAPGRGEDPEAPVGASV